MMKTLNAVGHTCDEAEDGAIAVEKIKEKGLTAYDAILMDFVMPVMDGPAATKVIRSLSFVRPIIGCTGNTLDMDVQRFHDRYVAIPIPSHRQPFIPTSFFRVSYTYNLMNEIIQSNHCIVTIHSSTTVVNSSLLIEISQSAIH